MIDVRAIADFDKGHIANAEHIVLTDLTKQPEKLEKYRNRPVVLVCATGQQSFSAGNCLKKQGVTRIASMTGGMNRWLTDNLPVIKA